MSNTRSNDMPMERPVLRRTSCVHCGDTNVSMSDPYRTRCQRCLNQNRNPYGTGPVTVRPNSERRNDGRKRSAAKPRRRRSKRSKRSRKSKKSRVVKRTKSRAKRSKSKARKSRSMRRKSTRPRRSRK